MGAKTKVIHTSQPKQPIISDPFQAKTVKLHPLTLTGPNLNRRIFFSSKFTRCVQKLAAERDTSPLNNRLFPLLSFAVILLLKMVSYVISILLYNSLSPDAIAADYCILN